MNNTIKKTMKTMMYASLCVIVKFTSYCLVTNAIRETC